LRKEEGSGWRLVEDSSRGEFSILIGSEFCSVEITNDEWLSMVPLLFDLIDQHKEYQNQLLAEESINLEMERENWWASLDGGKDSWSLKLIFNGNRSQIRSFEMYWPIQTAQTFVLAVRKMWDSYQ
tara:strand:+ start:592 stop:969 length:378 start_codon:yes stop_codon:yes gene_type:complete